MDKSEQDQLKKEAATKAAMMVEPGSVPAGLPFSVYIIA